MLVYPGSTRTDDLLRLALHHIGARSLKSPHGSLPIYGQQPLTCPIATVDWGQMNAQTWQKEQISCTYFEKDLPLPFEAYNRYH